MTKLTPERPKGDRVARRCGLPAGVRVRTVTSAMKPGDKAIPKPKTEARPKLRGVRVGAIVRYRTVMGHPIRELV
jgi:methyl coenzyme M reductase subunit C